MKPIINSNKLEKPNVVTNEVPLDKQHLGIDIRKQFNDKLIYTYSIIVECPSMAIDKAISQLTNFDMSIITKISNSNMMTHVDHEIYINLRLITTTFLVSLIVTQITEVILCKNHCTNIQSFLA